MRSEQGFLAITQQTTPVEVATSGPHDFLDPSFLTGSRSE